MYLNINLHAETMTEQFSFLQQTPFLVFDTFTGTFQVRHPVTRFQFQYHICKKVRQVPCPTMPNAAVERKLLPHIMYAYTRLPYAVFFHATGVSRNKLEMERLS
jgi:hypothetical protein